MLMPPYDLFYKLLKSEDEVILDDGEQQNNQPVMFYLMQALLAKCRYL